MGFEIFQREGIKGEIRGKETGRALPPLADLKKIAARFNAFSGGNVRFEVALGKAWRTKGNLVSTVDRNSLRE